jgi:DNA mismatch endonuclease (patch repair protein)
MVDVLTKEQRRLNMSCIRGKDTKPELMVRHSLHAKGLRYRLHRKDLPGRPDIVFPSYRAAILVHGCFWHGHKCSMFKMPSTRPDFWREKITANKARDKMAITDLSAAGWQVLVVWECALKGPHRQPLNEVTDQIINWLRKEDRRKLPFSGLVKEIAALPRTDMFALEQELDIVMMART